MTVITEIELNRSVITINKLNNNSENRKVNIQQNTMTKYNTRFKFRGRYGRY